MLFSRRQAYSLERKTAVNSRKGVSTSKSIFRQRLTAREWSSIYFRSPSGLWIDNRHYVSASFPVVLGDFGCDVDCQACRENRAIALGSKPPLFTRIARTGLGTRLTMCNTMRIFLIGYWYYLFIFCFFVFVDRGKAAKPKPAKTECLTVAG